MCNEQCAILILHIAHCTLLIGDRQPFTESPLVQGPGQGQETSPHLRRSRLQGSRIIRPVQFTAGRQAQAGRLGGDGLVELTQGRQYSRRIRTEPGNQAPGVVPGATEATIPVGIQPNRVG